MHRGRSRTAATSKMERFVIIANGWKPLTIITKRSILDVAAVLDPPLIQGRALHWIILQTVSHSCQKILVDALANPQGPSPFFDKLVFFLQYPSTLHLANKMRFSYLLNQHPVFKYLNPPLGQVNLVNLEKKKKDYTDGPNEQPLKIFKNLIKNTLIKNPKESKNLYIKELLLLNVFSSNSTPVDTLTKLNRYKRSICRPGCHIISCLN